MSASTLRNALGLLQDDPDHAGAYQDLRSTLGSGEPIEGLERGEVAKLLESARRAHAARLEFNAAASLLELELVQAQGTNREVGLLLELATVTEEHLFDAGRSAEIFGRVLALDPANAVAEAALETAVAKRAKWTELVKRYSDEAHNAGDAALKSSLLVSAAETAYRYGRPALTSEKGAKKRLAALLSEASARLDEAVAIDPANERAAALLEHVYRETKRWEELATLLEKSATGAVAKESKIASLLRLGRVCTKKLDAADRAASAYERVLDLSPENAVASSFLVDYFSSKQMWDHLVAVYQEQLGASTRAGQEDAGTALQIAMIHWKMRANPEAAEPYFERLRKVEPSHPGMLAFFREHLGARGDTQRLTQVLSDAQKAMPEGPARAQVGADIAKLAEEGVNATKAIEQWRLILRQDAANQDAREALKRLYRQSANPAALADLLRGDLERLAADDVPARLGVLRELASIYQGSSKNDTALVSVLSQIVGLDPADADAARALARIYEALGRFRDLLTMQARLAELEREPSVRGELYRQIARRWLDQFTNVQNGVEAYERLLEAVPTDPEACAKLRELYLKRRAYKSLYELIEAEASRAEGADRREKWLEMAKIAAERLDRGTDAVRLYKLVLAEDPAAASALDALEKQAERDKDFATVAEVIERRVVAAEDPAAKVALLQKLGALYTERLQDHAGSLSAWRRVMEAQPGHPKALRVLRESYLAVGDYDGLTALYAATSDWEGLAEVLSTAADKVTDTAAKVDLSFRAADVYTNKIVSAERAFRAYERVLGARPDDARAAAALVPIYEADEKWARLPALYEVLHGHASTDDERLVWLDKLFAVTGKHLQDRVAAFRYARRAYKMAPARLAVFERAAIESGEWTSFVEALGERLADGEAPAADQRAVRAKIAETYATQLGRVDEAIATYKTLVEQDPADEASVQTLDRILRSGNRKDELRWLFAERVSVANTARKLETLEEWATLEEEAFGAQVEATALYRRVLEIVPNHGRALRALARLLTAAGEPVEAASLLERDRDQREGKERAAREIDLARLYTGVLDRPADGLAALVRALGLVPGDRDAVALLEGLMARPETKRGAAMRLETAYADAGDAARRVAVVEVLISTTEAADERAALFDKLAALHEELGDAGAAFDVIVRAVAESPATVALWDRLGVLAVRTQRGEALVDALGKVIAAGGEDPIAPAIELALSERLADLFDELGETDRGRPYLERMLVLEPTNHEAFSRLKQLLTTGEDWTALEELYEVAVAASEPARQVELLVELAIIAEDISEDTDKAIGCHERVLAIEPGHPRASRALDSLYMMSERWADLASLLTRGVDLAPTDEQAALRVRLAALLIGKLEASARGLEQLALVLDADPASKTARELVEQVLLVPAHRQQAAAILEMVYSTGSSPRELVRILEARLEGQTSDDGKIDLLRRIAELRDEGLSEEVAAFDVYARLVPIAPDDAQARARLLDLARRVGSQAQAADALRAAAKASRAPQPRADILMELGRIEEDSLGNVDKAESAYREVLSLDPADAGLTLPAARALARIYESAGKSRELAEALAVEVKLEDGAEARRELYGRIGALRAGPLDDPQGAIAAWKARLEDDASDPAALAALDQLYERTGDYKALVEVLRVREQGASDAEARKALLLRLAQTLADKLSEVAEAISAYRAIQDEFGGDRPLLGALAMLYEIADRDDELAETLEADLDLADSTEERIALLVRLGAVRREKLGDLPAAFETYRQALTLDPSHAASRAALESLLLDERAQRDAASLLRPLYESDCEYAKLLAVIEIEIGLADSVGERLDLLSQAVVVAEQSLGDAPRAFAFAARGLKAAAGEVEFPAWLERTERLAGAAKLEVAFAAELRAVAPDVLNEAAQVEVLLKVASLARSHLSDTALAREYYEKALEVRGAEPRALEALELIYAELSNFTALSDVLQRQSEAAATEAERKGFLLKQARVAEESSGDLKFAIEVYELILELGADDAAVAALERLFGRTERFDDLVALYERQLGLSDDDEKMASLHARIGAVYASNLNDLDRAFDAYEAALKHDPQQPAVVSALESLMAQEATSGRAAEILETVYLARLDWRRVIEAISARLRASQDPDERRTLLKRLAKLHEEQEENYAAALEDAGKLLAEDVTDTVTWSELERLARVASSPRRLAEIFAGELARVTVDETSTAELCARTGELFEAQSESAQALVFYRRAYSFSPEDHAQLFESIDRLLTASGGHAERVSLYRGALEFEGDASKRLAMLHAIARMEEVELQQPAAAIETYRAAADLDDSDPVSLDALSRLYASAERFRDLADILRRRAEQSAMAEEEAGFRVQLASILRTKLGEVSEAIDEYQAVFDLVPSGPGAPEQAVGALEDLLSDADYKVRVIDILRPIFERTDDWRRLLALDHQRLEMTSDRADRVSILKEAARIWEERGADSGKAFESVRDAFVLDPEDGEARIDLDRLSVVTGRFDELADAYEKGIALAEDLTKRQLLSALAVLHDGRRDDPRKALDAYCRLFAADETEPDPLDQMDALATLLADWPTVVSVLLKKVELALDDGDRASLWRRVGEARRDMLDDVAGAIVAYEAALELEADSTWTLDNLLPLQESVKNDARLVELYARRVELASDEESELKFALLVSAADRFEHALSDRPKAIALLDEALAVQPGDPAVTERLGRLYRAEEMWPQLLDNLKLQAAAAPQDARREIKKAMGALLLSSLDDPRHALEVYREVLDGGFDDEAARAIRTLAEGNEELREEATDAVEPALRGAGKHAELADVLELRLLGQSLPETRAKTLRAIATVAEENLGDDARALAVLVRALAESADDAELHGEIMRLCDRGGGAGFAIYADALSERAAALLDARVSADLLVRLARVSEDHLKDDARAAAAYARATEQAGDSAPTLMALDALYTRLRDAKALSEVLERRISLEGAPALQADLYQRLAGIQQDEFGDKSLALSTLRSALERAPDHLASRAAVVRLLDDEGLFEEAFDALQGVYRSLGNSAELASLFERRVVRAHTAHEGVRARLELARVVEELLGDAARAQRIVEEAIGQDATDADALAELERLAPATDGWREASDALRRALDQQGADVPSSSRAELWSRVAGWLKDKLSDAPGAERALGDARKAEPENLQVLAAIEELQRVPGRERELIETLRERARLEGGTGARRDTLREAKALAESTVGDAALAEALVRELLVDDPSDGWALDELTRMRETAGAWAEVAALVVRQVEVEADGGAIARLRHRAAEVYADKLGDAERALELYRALFEADPSDSKATLALRALYTKTGDTRALGSLLATLVDMADSEAGRAALRTEIAKLQDARGETREAIETLRAILEENPASAAAVLALSELFDRHGHHDELAELLSAQLVQAQDRGDGDTEQTLQLRLASVYETRLNDTPRALEVYEAVLLRTPDHRDALESIARLAELRGSWDRAAAVLSTLLDQPAGASDIALALRLATALGALGDEAGVMSALRRALALDRSHVVTRDKLRALYEKSKSWSELAELLVSDADLAEDSGGAEKTPAVVAEVVKSLRRAAEIYHSELGAPGLAVPHFERASALAPSDRELLLALCDAYTKSGRERAATEVLEKIIASFGGKRSKELAVFHHRLGRALASLGEKDAAFAQFDLAFKIDPGAVAVLIEIALFALEIGDFERATRTFRALLLQRLDDKSGITKAEVFFYLGEVLLKQGDKTKALPMYERAIENDAGLAKARARVAELKG